MILRPVIANQKLAMLYQIRHFFCALTAAALSLLANTESSAAP
jgi:hypothetical protein